MKRISIIAMLVVSLTSPLLAQYEEEDFHLQPVMGVWFGPMTPFPGTELSKVLNAALGGGGFFRINIPSNTFQLETGVSFFTLTSLLTERLTVIPIYLAGVYKLPVDFALSFYFKAGGGMGYFANKPEGNNGYLPVFYGGFETSFPAGKVVNIGVRFDYYFAYETWMKPQANYKMIDGHFISIGIMANFNMNP